MNVTVFSTVAPLLQPLLQRVATQFTFTFSVAFDYWHERRTRALARLVSDERWAFVAAIRAHPAAAQGTARKARETFAHALMDARARDEAAMTEARHG
jgi:hypothetical protein